MPMTDKTARDKTTFIKANTTGLPRKIIRPAHVLTIGHYGNMTKALPVPFNNALMYPFAKRRPIVK